MKTKLTLFALLLALGVSASNYPDIFYKFPNSGKSFEALYTMPTNGSACVGDFNNDGNMDLIVMGPNYNTLELKDDKIPQLNGVKTHFVNLLLNDGNGNFTRHDLGLPGLSSGSIAYTKTGDKKYLLAIQGGSAPTAAANNSVAMVAELTIDGTTVTCTKKQDLTYGLFDGDIMFVDFNNDGAMDIVQFGGGRKVYTYLNNNNVFTLSTAVTGLKGTSRGKSKLYDVNKDGKADIVCIDQSYGLLVYLNSGNNSFTEVKPATDYAFKVKPRFEFGDFNKDGNIDIVAFDTNGATMESSVVFFYGDATGNFTQAAANNFMGVESAAVAVGDFNNDGNLDILYSGDNKKALKTDPETVYTQKAYFLLGDGKKGFTQHVKATPQRQNCDIFSLAPVGDGNYYSADFDNDGIPDVLALGSIGIGTPGKIMRTTELFLSGQPYGFGTPIVKPLIDEVWQGFPYHQVRLGEGRLMDAMNKNIAYLKSLDINRLFAATLSYNLGITGNQTYGGWEESGYGATFSHYLSAISMGYAATGDPELKERADKCVEIIIASQDYMGNGFFGFKDGTTWNFDRLARDKSIFMSGGDEYGHPWQTNTVGIPMYSHHKIFAALRDAYLYTGNEEARVGFIKFCEWLEKWMQNFDTPNFQKMLEAEHGGFVETLADAYALSGKAKFLDAARKFTRNNFAQSMSTNKDDLMGRHSNFHVPMAVGAAMHYLYSGDSRSQKTAHNFFEIVHDHHTLCNGGNGNNERFGTPDLLSYRLGMRGPETCSSYNMLKLAKDLFCQEGNAKYLDYYENTMYNHILAILSPRSDAGVCYHVSLKPGTFKVYDNLYSAFWCCVGTGMESHVKYTDAIYFKNEKDLLINLFTPSSLNWEEKGLKLKMETDFPATDVITLKLEQNSSFNGDIVVRYPKWAEKGAMEVTVNGAKKNIAGNPGDLVKISHAWQTGDEIKISIECKLRLVDLPDDVNVSAIFYGPVLLAANIGEVGQADVRASHYPEFDIANPTPDAYFPSLKITRDNLDAFIQKKSGTLEFKTKNLSENYTLKPFYDTHHCRYHVYWKLGDDADLAKEKELLIHDRVLTGVPESETSHNMVAESSATGIGVFSFWGSSYYHYRNASMTGSLSYDLNLLPTELPAEKQYYLQITYFGDEPSGYGNFRIHVDNTSIAYVGSLERLARLDFAQRYYAIPRNLTDGKQKITVKFSGGRMSHYGIKLLSTDNLIEEIAKQDGGSSIAEQQADDSNIWLHNRALHIDNAFGGNVSVYDIDGKLVYINSIKERASVFNLDLNSGVYIARVACDKKTETRKIIIQ